MNTMGFPETKISKILLLCFVTFILAIRLFGKDDVLYKRDIPVFRGIEYTEKRLGLIEKKHPIWALNLSGGSARAFAHIGVLRRMEEEGFRPDVIVTNSMGSIIGLAYAAGMSVEDIEDILTHISITDFFDISFPFNGGMIGTRRFEAFLAKIFGSIDISETPIPIFVVTEDLISRRQIISSRGDLIENMVSAFALP